MAGQEQNAASIFDIHLRAVTVALAGLVLLATIVLATSAAQAQTFTGLHTLNGGSDGGGTITGLVADRAGNLYGAAYTGGIPNCPYDQPGCGTVFKLARHGTGWTFSVIYSFTGVSDGW